MDGETNGPDNTADQNQSEVNESSAKSTIDGEVGNNGDIKKNSCCNKVVENQSAPSTPQEITNDKNETNNDSNHVEEEQPTTSAASSTPCADDISASILKRLENNDSEEDMSITEDESGEADEPKVELRVIFNKNPMPIKISLKRKVGDLKKIVEKSTNVTSSMMKVLVKGNAKDDVTLESLGLTNGSKVLIIGTSVSDVMKVTQKPTEKELEEETEGVSSNEPKNWCSLPRHQKIIDKGIPDDVMPGISNCNDALPPYPISGMVGPRGKVRLTFKLESDELWIGTKERTEKVSIGTIKAVISQPITGFEHYHIMAIQLGPTELSRFYIYWVPAQYVEAIKAALSP